MSTQVPHAEPVTRKGFWIAAYLAALHRVGAADAVTEADAAFDAADQRWKSSKTIGSWRFEHDYPVGTVFDEQGAHGPHA